MINNFSLKNDVTLTAKGVAYIKSFSNIYLAKKISKLVGGKEANRIIMGDDFKIIESLIPIIELRHKSIHRAIEIYGNNQILEIGSGFSTHGLEFINNVENVKYIEVDLKSLIKEKEYLVREILKINDSNLFFKGIDDLNYYDFLEKANIFDEETPVTIMSEGLLAYLNFSQKNKLVNNIYRILKKYGGAWITSDMPNNERIDFDKEQDCIVAKRSNNLSIYMKEREKSKIFKSKKDVIDFFSYKGFDINLVKQRDFVKDISSINSLDLDYMELDNVFNRREILILSLKSKK